MLNAAGLPPNRSRGTEAGRATASGFVDKLCRIWLPNSCSVETELPIIVVLRRSSGESTSNARGLPRASVGDVRGCCIQCDVRFFPGQMIATSATSPANREVTVPK